MAAELGAAIAGYDRLAPMFTNMLPVDLTQPEDVADVVLFLASDESKFITAHEIEQDIAQATGTRLGETITVQTAAGPASFRVIGISPQQQENGTALYVPLTTMNAILPGMPAYWVQTTSHDHAFIDQTTTRIEDTLTAHGYDVNSEIVYVRLANEIASERTLATAGWLIAIPLGYLLDWFLVWMVKNIFNLNITLAFPPWNLALALAGTILLALLITLVPIRHAARLRPGAALRYA